MKILGLKFKNINSLHGEWEIRFDRPPLSDTGLFAIVGPNGSGKSSILDALTLALYGETARLKSPGLDIMNWYGEESYSEVSFSLGESFYRSRWSMQRGNGTQDAPSMSLYHVNEEDQLLEDRVIKVRSRISELTGLDFKRFCRSILLAQGEFSAFLNALENERAEILERIIGPEIAQELEEAARSQVATESERLQQLKEAAAAFPVPDKIQVQEARQSREQLQEDIREQERIAEELQSVLDRLQKLGEVQAAAREADQLLDQAERSHLQAQQDLQRVVEARASARPFQEEMMALENLWAERDKLQDKITEGEEEAKTASHRIQELVGLLREVREELKEARARLDDHGEEWDTAARLDRQIEEGRARFLELVGQYEAAERARDERLREQAEIEGNMEAQEAKRREVQRWLDEHPHDSGLGDQLSALESLRERLISTHEDLKRQREKRAMARDTERLAFKDLKRAQASAQKIRYITERLLRRKTVRDRRLEESLQGGTLESLKGSLEEQRKKLSASWKLLRISSQYKQQGYGEELQNRMEELKAEESALHEALDLEQDGLKQLQGRIRMRDAVRRLAPERAELEGGMPCPLCGSLDHPYVDKGLPDFSELDATVRELTQRIRGLQEELSKLHENAQKLGIRGQTAERLLGEWAKFCAEAGVDWNITDIAGVKKEIQVNKEEIRRIKRRIRSARWNKFWGDLAGRSLEKKTEDLASRDQLREAALARHEGAVAELAAVTDRIEGLQEEHKSIREEMENRFTTCGEEVPPVQDLFRADTGPLMRLRSRHEVYSLKSDEHRGYSEEILSLEKRKERLPVEIEEIRGQIEDLARETQDLQALLTDLAHERDTSSSTVDPAGKRQAVEAEIDRCTAEESAFEQEMESLRLRIQELESLLPQWKQEAGKLKDDCIREEGALAEKAESHGFPHLEELRQLLWFLQREQEIAIQFQEAENALQEARSRALAAQNELESLRSLELAGESPDAVRWKITDAAKRKDELQRMLLEVETALSRYGEAEREYREILQAIATQEKIWGEVVGEQSALLSRDQAERRSRVQRLMLDRLIEKSNHYLTSLSGRYSLGYRDSNGLGMVVQDFLQENKLRSVKTLSGGEAFLVSLCLALGLSDMAGKHRKIESLFLDEGFGTLDEEMLYKVIAVLKSLRSNGKMVGVISHVKRLADEIPTQIKVERMAGGFSRITLVA